MNETGGFKPSGGSAFCEIKIQHLLNPTWNLSRKIMLIPVLDIVQIHGIQMDEFIQYPPWLPRQQSESFGCLCGPFSHVSSVI